MTLVDIRHAPIQEITPTGIRTEDGEYELDIIVFATGFDAMTGTFNRIDIQGRDGEKLKDKWAHGPLTYLGVATARVPELLHDHRPGLTLGAQQHAGLDRTARRVDLRCHRAHGRSRPRRHGGRRDGQKEWVAHVNEIAEQTMFMLADSWYLGANIPASPRVHAVSGRCWSGTAEKCNEVTEAGYTGFTLAASAPVA